MRISGLLGAAAIAVSAFAGAAPPALAETITYLFPAPPKLPAFGPIQLARAKGYY